MICFLRRARRCFAVRGAGAGVLTAWCMVGAVLRVKASGLVGCWTLANEIPFMITLRCSDKGLWIQLIAASFFDPVRRFRGGSQFAQLPIPRAPRSTAPGRLPRVRARKDRIDRLHCPRRRIHCEESRDA